MKRLNLICIICMLVFTFSINIEASENSVVTRAEMANKIIATFEEITEAKYGPALFNYPPFDDVSFNTQYSEEILLSCFFGFMVGVDDGVFCPDGTITRSQCATIIDRLIKEIESKLEVQNEIKVQNDNIYKDDNDIPLWAKDAVYSMRSYGLIVGDENNMFNPQDNLTEKHIDSILERVQNKYKE